MGKTAGISAYERTEPIRIVPQGELADRYCTAFEIDGRDPSDARPSGRQALELSDFSSSSLALSEGEILMTAYVIAIERARIAAM